MNARRRRIGTRPRPRLAGTAYRSSLEPRSAKRMGAALACLGVAYLLAWAEIPFELGWLPANGNGVTPPAAVAAAIVARVLVGALYACVALGYRWARWLTVMLGLLGLLFVVPTLPEVWRVSAAAALVTAFGALAKAAASVLLIPPLRRKPLHHGANDDCAVHDPQRKEPLH